MSNIVDELKLESIFGPPVGDPNTSAETEKKPAETTPSDPNADLLEYQTNSGPVNVPEKPEEKEEDPEVKGETPETKPEKKEEKELVKETKTEEPIEEEEEDDEGVAVFSTLIDEYGIEEFETDKEGMPALIELTDKIALKQAQTMFDAYMEQHSGMSELMKHLANGGQLSNYLENRYSNNVDYAEMIIDENDEAQQEMLVRAQYKAQNYTKEEIDVEIAELKSMDKMLARAKRALPILQRSQQANASKLAAEKEAETAKRNAEKTKYWNGVKATIDSGTVAGIHLPKSDQKNFFKWLSADTGGGKTAGNAAWEKLSQDQRLQIEYLVFKGMDISTLVAQKAKTESVKKLKIRLGKNGNRGLAGSGGTGKRTKKTTPSVSQQLDSLSKDFIFSN